MSVEKSTLWIRSQDRTRLTGPVRALCRSLLPTNILEISKRQSFDVSLEFQQHAENAICIFTQEELIHLMINNINLPNILVIF